MKGRDLTEGLSISYTATRSVVSPAKSLISGTGKSRSIRIQPFISIPFKLFL